jgi:hypothetical protein
MVHHIYSILLLSPTLYLFKTALSNKLYTIDNIVNCVDLTPIVWSRLFTYGPEVF